MNLKAKPGVGTPAMAAVLRGRLSTSSIRLHSGDQNASSTWSENKKLCPQPERPPPLPGHRGRVSDSGQLTDPETGVPPGPRILHFPSVRKLSLSDRSVTAGRSLLGSRDRALRATGHTKSRGGVVSRGPRTRGSHSKGHLDSGSAGLPPWRSLRQRPCAQHLPTAGRQAVARASRAVLLQLPVTRPGHRLPRGDGALCEDDIVIMHLRVPASRAQGTWAKPRPFLLPPGPPLTLPAEGEAMSPLCSQ